MPQNAPGPTYRPSAKTRRSTTALSTGTTGSMAVLLVSLAAAAGCASTSADEAPQPTQAAPAAPKASTDALPDLTQEFESGQCEEIKGAEVAGADSYFHGRFKISGEAVSGQETWWLHANQSWTERGGASCTIDWQVRGMKVATGACRDCDFGLQLAATPEVGNSKCPEELLKREGRPQDLRYDVRLSSNGEAFIYYSKSGKLLGQGFHKDGELVYRTQHQCKWF